MSRHIHYHPYSANTVTNQGPVVVHDHDVLSGRGVNIAHHPGNQRFRTLISTHGADTNYCTAYSAVEKKAVAEEIIHHIYGLDPPGRFLKRDGRGRSSRGLQGPWQVLSEREAIKKTTQALRDCNRQDREGYADGVAVPTDVERSALSRAQSGLTTKQLASQLACRKQQGSISPSVEHAAEWLQKQRTADDYHVNEVTPTTSDEMQEDSAATSLLSMAPSEYYTHSHTYPYYSTETDDVVEAAAAAAAAADSVYPEVSAHEAACLLAGDDGM
jgi:hypothetical protein